MKDSKKNTDRELSLSIIIILGLAPGVIILLLAFVFSSPLFGINFSIFLSLMLAIILGLIPVELGIMKFFAWETNRKLKDIILFKEKTPLKKLLFIVH